MISQEAFEQMKEDIRKGYSDVYINLWYPEQEGRPRALIVGLMDVRYAGDIRVSYDYERDGWVIEKEVKGTSGEWGEEAFVPGRRDK